MNGTINATTWQEFRVAMKEAGINTGTKTYEQLVEEYNKLNGQTVPAGDMSSDKYYPELQVTLDMKHGNAIVKDIVKASYVASKGDSKGKRVITMKRLFGIIKSAYSTNKKDNIEESFIKEIINQLITLKYLCYKKYESGAMIFYPTKKCLNVINN